MPKYSSPDADTTQAHVLSEVRLPKAVQNFIDLSAVVTPEHPSGALQKLAPLWEKHGIQHPPEIRSIVSGNFAVAARNTIILSEPSYRLLRMY